MSQTNSQNMSNNQKSNKNEFLDFLKKQQEINSEGNGLFTIIENNEMKNKNSMENVKKNIIGSQKYNLKKNNFNEINLDSQFTCLQQDIDNCTIDNGCNWNNESIICEDLNVTFFDGDKLNGESYKLKVGNYDIADIDNFEFSPEFIAVPYGLRVKIWHTKGFSGLFDAYLGNHKASVLEEQHLYKLKNLGSIQICNMISCEKPSPYSGMKLINVMDGNNVDRIDTNVISNIGEYKNKLRKNIINRVKYLKSTQSECIQEIINYLRHNGVNLHKNFLEENDIGVLQRIKFLLYNLPSCDNLLIYKNYRNPNEERRIKKILEKSCIQDEEGECEIRNDFAPVYDNSNILEKDLDIDNDMIHNIQNSMTNKKDCACDKNTNTNNTKNNKSNNTESNNTESNNNETKNKDEKKAYNNKMRKILEKIKVLKKKAETPVIVEVPGPVQTVYETAPAETVYITTPAETKIVYAPTETVYVDREVIVNAPAEKCNSPSPNENYEKQMLFGVSGKDSSIVKFLNKVVNSSVYNQISLVFIFLTLFALYIARKKR